MSKENESTLNEVKSKLAQFFNLPFLPEDGDVLIIIEYLLFDLTNKNREVQLLRNLTHEGDSGG